MEVLVWLLNTKSTKQLSRPKQSICDYLKLRNIRTAWTLFMLSFLCWYLHIKDFFRKAWVHLWVPFSSTACAHFLIKIHHYYPQETSIPNLAFVVFTVIVSKNSKPYQTIKDHVIKNKGRKEKAVRVYYGEDSNEVINCLRRMSL